MLTEYVSVSGTKGETFQSETMKALAATAGVVWGELLGSKRYTIVEAGATRLLALGGPVPIAALRAEFEVKPE